MSDFIPFPNPPGNTGSRQPITAEHGFSAGQDIKVNVTATAGSATNDSLTATRTIQSS